jgi:alkylated DNA nucleotide flippase Atl1
MIRKALGHVISCREVSRLLSRSQDETIPPWQRLRLRAHLAICDACARFERQLRLLRLAMRKYVE